MTKVETFINAITNETKQSDCRVLLDTLAQASGYSATLHGSIIGFGRYHYKYDKGREGDSFCHWFLATKAECSGLYHARLFKLSALTRKVG